MRAHVAAGTAPSQKGALAEHERPPGSRRSSPAFRNWRWASEIQSSQALSTLKGSECGDHRCIPSRLFLHGRWEGSKVGWERPVWLGRCMRDMPSPFSLFLSFFYGEGACSFTYLFVVFLSPQLGQGAWPLSVLCTPESVASGTMPGTEQALQSRLLSD